MIGVGLRAAGVPCAGWWGGLRGRSRGSWPRCTPMPSLISVLEPFEFGDMMGDGGSRVERCGRSVFQGVRAGSWSAGILRELAAVISVVGAQAVHRGVRRQAAGSRASVAELAHAVMDATQELARDREHGAVLPHTLLELQVVGVVG